MRSAGVAASALALVFALMPGPAFAHDPSLVPPSLRQAQAPAHNPLDCWCRAQGRIFAIGESICLRTAAGGRMAECRMETNVTSWGITDQPCPES